MTSIVTTDGTLWAESKSRHAVEGQPIPSRCGEHQSLSIAACIDATARTEELPIRLAHRVKELDQLPHNLSHMPSIKKVKDWYAQSFEVYPLGAPAATFRGLLLLGTRHLPNN